MSSCSRKTYRNWLNEDRKPRRAGCGAVALALVLWSAGVAAAWFVGGPAVLGGACLMLAAVTVFAR